MFLFCECENNLSVFIRRAIEFAFAKALGITDSFDNRHSEMIVYGYLPMMKFRSCPMKGQKGCGSCTGFNYLTDRTDTRFPLICRERQYSELLNHLPVYTADKGGPQLDFECLYFTIERPDAVRGIYESYVKGEAPSFLRTAGLYQRKLL